MQQGEGRWSRGMIHENFFSSCTIGSCTRTLNFYDLHNIFQYHFTMKIYEGCVLIVLIPVHFLWRTGVRNCLYLNSACKSKINLEVATPVRTFSVIYQFFYMLCCLGERGRYRWVDVWLLYIWIVVVWGAMIALKNQLWTVSGVISWQKQ